MINVYANQIREYVEQNLDMALLAGYSDGTYDRINKERENLNLYRNMVLNPELREQIITNIVSYTIKNTNASFKPELPKNACDSYYMNAVKSFLNSHQLVLLAKYFNQEVQNRRTR